MRIIDENNTPNNNDNMCYFIIQDGNMRGNFWYISSCYINCQNKYTNTIMNQHIILTKMKEISEGDIISLKDNPEIKFRVYECKCPKV